ncbi:hypothetical protein [Kocuria sp.]|uniref:hypothetical protein n=1 Tax=Kocuria sp. TaxID=1871328 RepID=UPI0026E10E8F|nr:hypothetical protein [Kocuria sp.]MDO5618823.1 hypothetical protein [Kocuria sp.]
MINLLRAETLRLRHNPAVRLALILTWVCAFVAAGVIWLSRQLSSGGSFSSYGTGALSEVVVGISLSVLLVSVIVAQDYEHSTAKAVNLVCSAGQIVTVKAILLVAGVGLILLPYSVVALIGLFPFGDFLWGSPSPLMGAALNSTIFPGGDRAARTVVVILATVLNIAAQVSICLPLAFWLRRTWPTLGIGIAAVFLLQVLANSFDRVPYVGALWQMTPFSWNRWLPLPFTETEMVASIAVSVFFMAAMVLFSYAIVRRRDLN